MPPLAEVAMFRANVLKLCVFGILLLVVGGFIGYGWLGMKMSMGDGSMDEAKRLRPIVEGISGPDAHVGEAGYRAIRFENGEWVAGVAKDSHALYAQWYGGGTVVLKDSRGRVRCFFGHVCGSGSLGGPHSVQSLDEFDADITAKFTEQLWP
jgi:hypothetical protein